jgi:hypothetical protein
LGGRAEVPRGKSRREKESAGTGVGSFWALQGAAMGWLWAQHESANRAREGALTVRDGWWDAGAPPPHIVDEAPFSRVQVPGQSLLWL